MATIMCMVSRTKELSTPPSPGFLSKVGSFFACGTSWLGRKVGSAASSVSTTVGQVAYTKVPGVKSAALSLSQKTIDNVLLPSAGVYKKEIEEARKKLKKQSGKSILNESCRIFASFATDFLTHQIKMGGKLPPSLRSGFLNSLLDNEHSKEPALSYSGDVFSHILQKHPALFTEIIEYNLLEIFTNLLTKLQHVEKTNQDCLLDLIKDSVTIYHKILEKGTPISSEHGAESPLLSESLYEKLLNIALPQGAEDLKLPINGGPIRTIVKNQILVVLRDMLLSKILNLSYQHSTSDACKTTLTKISFEYVQDFLKDGFDAFPSNTAIDEEGKKEQFYYEKQEEFEHECSNVIKLLWKKIDPSLLSAAGEFGNKICKSLANFLLEQAGTIHMTALLNFVFEITLPAFNGGEWQADGFFKDHKNTFFSSLEQVQNFEKEHKTEQHTIKLETKQSVSQFMTHTHGLSKALASLWIGAPSTKDLMPLLDKEGLKDACIGLIKILFEKCITLLLDIFLIFGGKRLIQRPCERALHQLEPITLSSLTHPLETALINNLK